MVEGGNYCDLAPLSFRQKKEQIIRGFLDNVDLEELPDSRERTGAFVLWLSCEGQADVWDMFQTILIWAPFLTDKDFFLLAAPIDFRTKKADNLPPQLLHGFWYKLQKKNPKIVAMSPIVATKSYNEQEVIWQQYHLCLVVPEHQIFGGKHFLVLGRETGSIWWLKKVQYLQKGTIANELSCVKKCKWIFSQSWQLVTTVRMHPSLASASESYRVASSDNIWRLCPW